jgi:hypothetical protein
MKEDKRFEQSRPLGDIVEKLIKAYGLEDKMLEMSVIEAWPELMGKAVSYRTNQLYIRNRRLHIHLNSSVMREELLFGKQIIIERVNQFAGKSIIDDVWFE